mmetsp:Transcript_8368/g.30599  ORF Transcript_8368/g.30599 Transcript_8368/m.30599 type:complete len:238 (+) Transcript_8368:1107-1820(+)
MIRDRASGSGGELLHRPARRGDAERVEHADDVAAPGSEERLAEKRLAVNVRDAGAHDPVAVAEAQRIERGARSRGVTVEHGFVRVRVHGHDVRVFRESAAEEAVAVVLRFLRAAAVGGGGVGVAVRVVVLAAAHRAPRLEVELEHERVVVVRVVVEPRRRLRDGQLAPGLQSSAGVVLVLVLVVVLPPLPLLLLVDGRDRRVAARDERRDVEKFLHALRERRRVEEVLREIRGAVRL